MITKKLIAKTAFIIILIIITIIGITQIFPKQDKYIGSIKKGAEWFINNQNDTFLHNQFDIEKNAHTGTRNYIRELGAVWTIGKLATFLNDNRLKTLSTRGINYFAQYFKYDEPGDFYYLNISPNIKLGYSAFIILALLENEYPNKGYYMEKFANGIIKLQNANGSFQTNFKREEDVKNIDHDPGQALFALMSLYNHTKNRKYLIPVQKAFPYYVKKFREHRTLDFTPWQTRAYYLLYNNTYESELAGFILEMNDFVLSEYSPQQSCSQFNFTNAGSELALYTQGVIYAQKLATEIRDENHANCYKQFIKESAKHIMTLQVAPRDASTPAATGGFLTTRDSNIVNIENTQYALMTLMEAY